MECYEDKVPEVFKSSLLLTSRQGMCSALNTELGFDVSYSWRDITDTCILGAFHVLDNFDNFLGLDTMSNASCKDSSGMH